VCVCVCVCVCVYLSVCACACIIINSFAWYSRCLTVQIGVVILFIFCIAAGICYVVFGFVERAKNGGGGGGAGTPSGSVCTMFRQPCPSTRPPRRWCCRRSTLILFRRVLCFVLLCLRMVGDHSIRRAPLTLTERRQSRTFLKRKALSLRVRIGCGTLASCAEQPKVKLQTLLRHHSCAVAIKPSLCTLQNLSPHLCCLW